SDAFVVTWLRDRLLEQNRPEAKLLDGILTRQLFKRLWVISRESVQEKQWDELVRIWDRLDRKDKDRASKGFEKKIKDRLVPGSVRDVTTMSAKNALELVDQMTSAQEPWLLIDIPGGRPGSEVGLRYVVESQARRLRKDDRAVGDLLESSVWKQYAKELQMV